MGSAAHRAVGAAALDSSSAAVPLRSLFFIAALSDSIAGPIMRSRQTLPTATDARRNGSEREDTRMTSLCRILVRTLALAVAIVAMPAWAQDYPSRPVTIVVGYTPGATSDLLARTVGERLNAAWGQSVIVDNRSGVGGNIAAGYVARAPADGYTLLVGTDAILTSNVFLYKNTPFDPVKDFAPITNAGANIICLAVHVDLPVRSVAELIAYAKADPGKLQYGSSGIGSPHHLAGELLRQKTGIEVVHVPYRGGGATINDLIGGHIKVAFLSLSTAVPHLTSGKIRIVAVVEKTRYAAMPDVPTIGETVPGFEMSSWLGFLAPAATPAPLIARLNEAMVKVLTTDAVKDKLATLGLVVAPSTPAELAAVIKEGLAVRGQLVKAANIQAE
jgi:tripartite-type tricarboxylate transporter receptor subunit TctC